MSKIFRLKVR